MKTLFEGTSKYYAKYRPSYPPEMLEDVVKKFNLNGKGKLLDVGCGPGILSIPLSKHFEEVLTVDVDPGMIQEGKNAAEKMKIKNILWLNKSADNLDKTIGTFKLITFGASFHWLDREKFAKLAYSILPEDGGIFIAWTGHSIWNKKRNNWEEKVLEIIKKYLGNERKAGNGFYQKTADKHEDILKKSGFLKIELKNYPSAPKTDTASDIIKAQYTTSYAAKNLFGDNAQNFEKEVTQELLKINPNNKFLETHVAGSIYAWKN